MSRPVRSRLTPFETLRTEAAASPNTMTSSWLHVPPRGVVARLADVADSPAQARRLEPAVGEKSKLLAVGRPERIGGVYGAGSARASTRSSLGSRTSAVCPSVRPRMRVRPSGDTANCMMPTIECVKRALALAGDLPGTEQWRRTRAVRPPSRRLRNASAVTTAATAGTISGPARLAAMSGTAPDASWVTHSNSRAMSAADCQRSSGSFASTSRRRGPARRARAAEALDRRAVPSFMIAPITLAGESPLKARCPVTIS